MKVSRSELIELFAELGVPTAQGWSEEKLRKRVAQLPDIESRPKSSEMKTLHSNLLELLEENLPVNITGFDEADTEKPARAAKPAKATKTSKASSEKNGHATKAEKNGHAVKEKKTSKRGTGVCATIIATLQAASEAKPVTKQQILTVLAKKFPEREPQRMKRTIAGIRTWIRDEKGLPVKMSEDKKGFWIPVGK